MRRFPAPAPHRDLELTAGEPGYGGRPPTQPQERMVMAFSTRRLPARAARGRLMSILLGSAILFGPGAIVAQESQVLVSADWLAQHLEDPDLVVLYVDMGHRGMPDEVIPGTRFLDYHLIAVERDGLSIELAPVDDLVAAFRAVGVSNDSRVVAYGDPGHMPARVFMTLDYLGLGDRTSVLDGGLAAWKAAGGSTTTEATEAMEHGDLEARVRTDMLVSAEWIRDRLEDARVVLIDARPENEYTGQRPGRDNLRGGHIPGAYNLYWAELTESAELPRLKELDEVRARFAEAGAVEDGVVVSYCLIGMRASYTYLVSRHLGYDARFYDASWNEWGARDDLPAVAGTARR